MTIEEFSNHVKKQGKFVFSISNKYLPPIGPNMNPFIIVNSRQNSFDSNLLADVEIKKEGYENKFIESLRISDLVIVHDFDKEIEELENFVKAFKL